MSTTTGNLGLDKRSSTDKFNNTKLNENWDKIDSEIGSDTAGGLKKRAKDIENNIDVIEADINTAESEIDQAQSEVDAAELEIDELQARENPSGYGSRITALENLKGTSAGKLFLIPATMVAGDLLTYDGSNLVRLEKGTTGQALMMKSDGTVYWGDIELFKWKTPNTVKNSLTITGADVYSALLDITGDGVLTNIKSANASTVAAKYKIIVDGGTPAIVTPLVATYYTGGMSEYTCMLRFSTSLKIEVCHTDASTQTLTCQADYMTL